jgi:fatty acid desaturase
MSRLFIFASLLYQLAELSTTSFYRVYSSFTGTYRDFRLLPLRLKKEQSRKLLLLGYWFSLVLVAVCLLAGGALALAVIGVLLSGWLLWILPLGGFGLLDLEGCH